MVTTIYCQEPSIPPNVSKHTGELQGTTLDGKVKIIFPDRSSFVGDFKDEKANGYGTFTNSNGLKYIGEWQGGFMHGQGTLFFPKDHKYKMYVGEFRSHQFFGKGTLSMPDGGKWEGEFRGNEMNGWGTMTYPFGGTDRVLFINSKYVRTAK